MILLSRRELDHLSRLKRRRDWLHNRIASVSDNKNLSWDKAELSALEWAIKLIEDLNND